MAKKTKRIRKKISKQKVFWAISIAFLFSCCVFYGGRLIYYYNKFKVKAEEVTTLYQDVINSNYNDKTVNNIGGTYYFTGSDVNNYVLYSNILFRIVKLNEDESVTLITDKVVGDLAIGEDKKFTESYIFNWLNDTKEDNTGIFVNVLNNRSKFLDVSSTCLDAVDKASNKKCKDVNNDNYVTLLSLTDYINTGNVDSFINNGEYFYLSNNNSENDAWFVSDAGKVGTNDGTDVYGIRPVITLRSGTSIISGDGSKDKPYIIEKEFGPFGGYVKLGEDTWRIYQFDDNEYKLMLDNYLMVDSEKYESEYSNKTYKYNDTEWGSLAYYLNKTYLDSLSYKDKIVESSYNNGYYMKEDYKDIVKSSIKTKVSVISVGNIILNSELDGYYTNTGNVESGKMIYIVKNNGRMVTKSIGSNSYVVPCITINKKDITKGDGSKNNPYELEG